MRGGRHMGHAVSGVFFAVSLRILGGVNILSSASASYHVT